MYLFRTVQADMEFLLKICWSIEFKQKAEIADSLSLLISCSAIFDFYLGKAKHLSLIHILFWRTEQSETGDHPDFAFDDCGCCICKLYKCL